MRSIAHIFVAFSEKLNFKNHGRNALVKAVFLLAILQLLNFQLELLIKDHCDIHILITLDSRLSNCDVTSDEFEEVEYEINNTEIYLLPNSKNEFKVLGHFRSQGSKGNKGKCPQFWETFLILMVVFYISMAKTVKKSTSYTL